MDFDVDGLFQINKRSGWQAILEFIDKFDVDRDYKSQLNQMKKDKEKHLTKKMEAELNEQVNFEKNKIPYYLKLREATMRDIELKPHERNLVNIRENFDKIRRNEMALNSWLINLKRKVTKKKAAAIREEHNKLLGLDESPRRGSLFKRRLSLRKASLTKINQNLSFVAHNNKGMTDRKTFSHNLKLSFTSRRNKSSISQRRFYSGTGSPDKSSNFNKKRIIFDSTKHSKNMVLSFIMIYFSFCWTRRESLHTVICQNQFKRTTSIDLFMTEFQR